MLFTALHTTTMHLHISGRVTVLTIPGGATSVNIVHPLKPGEGTLGEWVWLLEVHWGGGDDSPGSDTSFHGSSTQERDIQFTV